ncbi:MAG: dTDP-4-dehydrorhamnose 3,5-epimerase family protein [Acidobacteriota bacterium]|nr:dTDP-4-dehydrorhamnose 3,5-epimerase family protein [Acidobacteriota bacterium]
MTFTELALRGVWMIEPQAFEDERGAFHRSYCAREFADHGLAATVAQGNVSVNPHVGTLRGFHFQSAPFAEAKTLSCLSGALYDIVVDLRPESPTFLQSVSVAFSAQDRRSLHVPAGCANAWLTTSPDTTVHYYMSEFYAPASYGGFRYDDPAFRFAWPLAPRVISEKDRSFPDFDPASRVRP